MGSFHDYTLERLGRVEKKPSYPSLNEPVLLFNRLRIYEVGGALGVVVVFGVVRADWLTAIVLTLTLLLGSPLLRKKIPPTYLFRKFLDHFSKLPKGSFTWGRSKSSF